MTRLSVPSQERGVALAVALFLLVILTLLALSGIRLSTMELRIATNDELRVQAFEQAQSLIDATIRDFNNTPVVGPNVVLCARDCTNATVTLPDSYDDDIANDRIQVTIQRIEPQSAEPPVGTGFSLTTFDAAYLRVDGTYDHTADGRGKAQINEGVAVVYGAAGDISVANRASELTGTN